jgi:hypothetical protein
VASDAHLSSPFFNGFACELPLNVPELARMR